VDYTVTYGKAAVLASGSPVSGVSWPTTTNQWRWQH